MTQRAAAVAVVAALVCAGCAQSAGAPSAPSAPASSSGHAPASPSASPSPSGSRSVAPSASAVPEFQAATSRIDAALATRMKRSWRPGCPVPLADLRYVTVSYLDFHGASRTGELVVHEDAAADLVDAFRALYTAHFPIRSMRLVDDYGADDDRSMAADNTSAFNCRASTGSPGDWSQHSYGRAVDINPRENPYVSGSTVLPPSGAPYVDRSVRARGLIRTDGAVVRAFAAIGWTWGGDYRQAKDYQHFSANGR